jgi:hypothetical protein
LGEDHRNGCFIFKFLSFGVHPDSQNLHTEKRYFVKMKKIIGLIHQMTDYTLPSQWFLAPARLYAYQPRQQIAQIPVVLSKEGAVISIWWEDVSGDKGVSRERIVSMRPLTLIL